MMSDGHAQPLEVLRTYIKGNGTMDLDRAATQQLWDECQKAEDEILRMELRLKRIDEARKGWRL